MITFLNIKGNGLVRIIETEIAVPGSAVNLRWMEVVHYSLSRYSLQRDLKCVCAANELYWPAAGSESTAVSIMSLLARPAIHLPLLYMIMAQMMIMSKMGMTLVLVSRDMNRDCEEDDDGGDNDNVVLPKEIMRFSFFYLVLCCV